MATKPTNEIPKGQQSVEDQGDGRPVNERGLWVHDEASRQQGEMVALEALSQPAADAFLRMGFRPATENEVREYDARVEAAKKLKVETYKTQQESALADK